jgi:hypothetical protein
METTYTDSFEDDEFDDTAYVNTGGIGALEMKKALEMRKALAKHLKKKWRKSKGEFPT